MADLVDRLGTVGLWGEAREEILRLRAEVASLKENIVQFDKTAFDAERARTKAAIEAYKKSLKPVAWGVPNSRPTERYPFLSLLHEIPPNGGVDGRRKTPIYEAMLVPLYRLDGEVKA